MPLRLEFSMHLAQSRSLTTAAILVFRIVGVSALAVVGTAFLVTGCGGGDGGDDGGSGDAPSCGTSGCKVTASDAAMGGV